MDYCLDTSSLLDGWQRIYPPDIFPGVWEHLETKVEEGIFYSPDEVFAELERKSDDILEWAKDRSLMFIPPNSNVQTHVSTIVNNYPEFVPKDSLDGIWADPYVIAMAKERNATVVTGEKPKGPNARIQKIPNICDKMGVNWIGITQLLRETGLVL